jgi:hypothetical protein
VTSEEYAALPLAIAGFAGFDLAVSFAQSDSVDEYDNLLFRGWVKEVADVLL